jgi:predicted CopG family antitoxin
MLALSTINQNEVFSHVISRLIGKTGDLIIMFFKVSGDEISDLVPEDRRDRRYDGRAVADNTTLLK